MGLEDEATRGKSLPMIKLIRLPNVMELQVIYKESQSLSR